MFKQNLLPGLGGSLAFLAASTIGPRINFDNPARTELGSANVAQALGDTPPPIQGDGTRMSSNVSQTFLTASGNPAGADLFGGGPGLRLLQSNGDVNVLRTNTVLRKDEWILFDDTVREITRQRMTGVSDLMARNLRTPIPNALGHTRIEWQRMSDFTGAEVSMSGISESENDRLTFDLVGMPLPIIHKDFNMNIRHLMASRNIGRPLDTLQVAYATKVVIERIEQILMLGSTALGTNNGIYGYTTTPNRVTGSVTANWATTATGAQILADVQAMVQTAINNNMYGPYVIYYPTTMSVKWSNDYAPGTSNSVTIRQRVLQIEGIQDIRPSPWLTGTNVVLVQMTKDVVDMIDGLQPTLVEWESHGGMVFHFKVMAIMVPRMRVDQASQKGIIHYS
jgi:uncharacterized linocin/CFP29 family protein